LKSLISVFLSVLVTSCTVFQQTPVTRTNYQNLAVGDKVLIKSAGSEYKIKIETIDEFGIAGTSLPKTPITIAFENISELYLYDKAKSKSNTTIFIIGTIVIVLGVIIGIGFIQLNKSVF